MQITKKTQRQASIAAVSGLVIIGAVSLLFKTYPHLNPFSCNSKKEEIEKKEDTIEGSNEVSTEESTVIVPDYSKLSYEELTSLLKEKNITIPENATLEDLLELTKNI